MCEHRPHALVAAARPGDLLLRAKHLFVAARKGSLPRARGLLHDDHLCGERRALGIEQAIPSAIVATAATVVRVCWTGTSGLGLPQLAARTTRYSARARRLRH